MMLIHPVQARNRSVPILRALKQTAFVITSGQIPVNPAIGEAPEGIAAPSIFCMA